MDRLYHKVLDVLFIRHDQLPDTELNQYVLMLTVSMITCAGHLFYAVLFASIRCFVLAAVHLTSIAIAVLCGLITTRRRYDAACVILSATVLAAAFGSIYYVGGDHCSIFFEFTILVLLMVIPFRNALIRPAAMVIVPLFMIISHFYGMRYQPVFPIGSFANVLSAANILLNAVIIIVILSLESFSRTILDGYKQQKIEDLESQAYIDPLTGLYNRRYSEMYFGTLKSHTHRENASVAMLDLDDFKGVNDQYGHDTGDVVLKAVSDMIMQSTRKSDLVCRWGGEEILIALVNASLEDAYAHMEKLRKRIESTPIQCANHIINVTVTIGIARLNPDDLARSIETCDRNMYKGKRRGKNQVVVSYG